MKDGRFEMEDLTDMDKHAALIILLIQKGIITREEYVQSLKMFLEVKNEALEKELEKNPAMRTVMDLMKGMNK